jgi:hypothetical protein
MMSGMGSMMGSMTLAGLLGALLIGILVIAAAVAIVRLLSPKSIGGMFLMRSMGGTMK